MADIFGVRVTSTLDTVNSFIINNSVGGQVEPAVVFNGENYIVAWLDFGVTAVRVTPSGVVLDSGNYIGAGNASIDLAFDGERTLAVWFKDYYGVCARFINSQAMPEDTVLRLDSTITTAAVPCVAYDGTNYLVVWQDFCPAGTDLDIYGQFLSSQGTLVGNKISIAAASAAETKPAICFDGDNYFVVWLQDDHAIYGRKIPPDGHIVEPAFQISDSVIFTRDLPMVCAGDSDFLTAWMEWRNDYDIYASLNNTISIKESSGKRPDFQHTCSIVGDLLEIKAGFSWSIYSINGRLLKQQAVGRNRVSKIDFSDFASGVYFVRLKKDSVDIIEKIIKVR